MFSNKMKNAHILVIRNNLCCRYLTYVYKNVHCNSGLSSKGTETSSRLIKNIVIKKVCYILTIKYQSANRKNEIDLHVLIWNDHPNVLVGKKLQDAEQCVWCSFNFLKATYAYRCQWKWCCKGDGAPGSRPSIL